MLQQAWKATDTLLIFVEPGTPLAFQRALTYREILLQQGAYLWAPCPHPLPCPMARERPSDWCHVHTRLPRTQSHRRMKQATLGFEDEPYLYLIAGKIPCPQQGWSRIVHTPSQRKGCIGLKTCQPDGTLKDLMFTKKKHGDAYTRARKLHWGDRVKPGP